MSVFYWIPRKFDTLNLCTFYVKVKTLVYYINEKINAGGLDALVH